MVVYAAEYLKAYMVKSATVGVLQLSWISSVEVISGIKFMAISRREVINIDSNDRSWI